MDTPLVSICCITYNHASYIRQAMDSFLMQKTTFAFEIIINDDASTDGTDDIIREYQRKYPDLITAVFHDENEYSKNLRAINIRNTFPLAKGKYIAMCEGDDYWADCFKIQKQVDFLEKNIDYVITFHDAVVINDSGEIVVQSKLGDSRRIDRTQKDMVSGILIPTLTVLFRNVIKEYPTEMYKVKNGDTFLFALLSKYGKGKFISEVEPAVYRQHPGGVWSLSSEKQRIFDSVLTYKLLLNCIDDQFRYIIREKLLHLSLLKAYFEDGLLNKIKQYFSSFLYLRPTKSSTRRFLIAHYLMFRYIIKQK